MRGPEAQQKRRLEEQIRSVADNLYKKKTYLRDFATDFEERRRMMHEIED
jgi:hypothetical protein